ncbi:MAG: hypothetical protein JNJ83_13600 [Verrucomicrobiaceae bacterium]|nr:hypothetical protein [Verrucomicrobiaceae bacterium]
MDTRDSKREKELQDASDAKETEKKLSAPSLRSSSGVDWIDNPPSKAESDGSERQIQGEAEIIGESDASPFITKEDDGKPEVDAASSTALEQESEANDTQADPSAANDDLKDQGEGSLQVRLDDSGVQAVHEKRERMELIAEVLERHGDAQNAHNAHLKDAHDATTAVALGAALLSEVLKRKLRGEANE